MTRPKVEIVPGLWPKWAVMQVWPGPTIKLNGRQLLDGWRPTDMGLAHELVHVEQYRRYGTFGFLVRYFWAYVRGLRYHDHPLEEEAEARAVEFIEEAHALNRDIVQLLVDAYV
jgi:hypothetical protein